jgi:hypothetical protein
MSDDEIRPPKIQNVLAAVMITHRERNRRWPQMAPHDPFEFADWWTGIMEPPNIPFDNPQRVVADKKIGWHTPYDDRLKSYLQKFLAFNHAQQVWVLANVNRGIPYRGDDGIMYARIVKEHETMKKNPDEYIGKASAVLAAFKN